MKYSNDTIGKRTRYLPVCSTVPQQTATPRSSVNMLKVAINHRMQRVYAQKLQPLVFNIAS
jgi:hypothetical protein